MRTLSVCRSRHPGGRTGPRRRRRRVMAGTAARGSSGTSTPLDFDFDGADVDFVVEDLPAAGALPRLLEFGPFLPFPGGGAVPPADFAVGPVEDFDVVVVLVQDLGAVGAVVVVDDAEAAWSCVIWMLTWPSLESELPSLATKLKASTSTPAGAW